MGILLTTSRVYIPGFLKRRKLRELLAATAEAFGEASPSLKGLSLDECLKQFAMFTRDNAEKAIEQKNELQTKNRLYQSAFRIGQRLRTDFKLTNLNEAMLMSEVVYEILRINFKGDPGGNILVSKCFFSRYYSEGVCRLISSLDEGLLAGLSGGGKLDFSQRITEGYGCCQARLSFERVGV